MKTPCEGGDGLIMAGRLFQPGDIVIVRNDLVERGKYYMNDGVSRNSFVGSMKPYLGKMVTIDKVGSQYTIKEDGGMWLWTDEMFDGVKDVAGLDVAEDLSLLYGWLK